MKTNPIHLHVFSRILLMYTCAIQGAIPLPDTRCDCDSVESPADEVLLTDR